MLASMEMGKLYFIAQVNHASAHRWSESSQAGITSEEVCSEGHHEFEVQVYHLLAAANLTSIALTFLSDTDVVLT